MLYDFFFWVLWNYSCVKIIEIIICLHGSARFVKIEIDLKVGHTRIMCVKTHDCECIKAHDCASCGYRLRSASQRYAYVHCSNEKASHTPSSPWWHVGQRLGHGSPYGPIYNLVQIKLIHLNSMVCTGLIQPIIEF